MFALTEHLGLIEPQLCKGPNEPVTSFMRPAPLPNDDETATQEDDAVADPLSDNTDALWTHTAKSNRDIFTEIFRPVPTNFIRTWDAYDVCLASSCVMSCAELFLQGYVAKTKTDHVYPGIPLARIEDRLSQVKGSLVECPLVRRP